MEACQPSGPLTGESLPWQVCGGEVGQKKKWNGLSIMKRGVTGDLRLEGSSLLCVGSPDTCGHSEVADRAANAAMSGSTAMQQQVCVFMAYVTTKDHVDVPSLGCHLGPC